MTGVVKWLSPVRNCDLCHTSIRVTFVDGKTRGGPWALMCIACFSYHGVGLGTGHGQRYKKDGQGEFIKVEG